MRSYTMNDIQELLQAVRGEKKVKSQEVDIRKEYIQAAIDEIFSENDFKFNERVTAPDSLLDYDADTGGFEAPGDFSAFNEFSAQDSVTGRIYDQDELDIRFDNSDTIVIIAPTTNSLFLKYHILPPNMLATDADANTAVRFPQGYLIAERAYVRLKVAYMPDEDSTKEYKASRAACRLLANRNTSAESFTPGRR